MSNTKHGKEGLIPKLRFPEFLYEDEWVEKSLGEVATFSKGKGISKSDISKKGCLPCIRYGELYTHYKEVIKDIKSSTNLSSEDLIISEVNDVIIPSSGETHIDIATASCLLRSGVALGGDLNIIKSKINGVFLSYYLNFAKKREIAQMAQGISVVHLYSNQLKNLLINIPRPGEQQKIASCLSSLDELIAAQTEKLEALQDHKKGLMQNLFPQEGQSVPNFRFPEFEGDGEWVEKKLGDVADFINGRAYKKEELLSSGKYRVLRVGNFFTNNEWYYSDLELEEDKYCENGDLLYAWSASFGPRIWKQEKVIYHYHIWKVVQRSMIDKQFLFVILDFETENIKETQARGLGMQHLTKSGIESWESKIPPTINEQQKIASCLSEVGNLILAQKEKIDQLQKHKKGLMQGLFPNMKE
ncbi:restriction endonuclease subunit S [Algoriphagus aestuarii]|nr:restriction endonuclease subunit S [Algoriphagus aestuarii]